MIENLWEPQPIVVICEGMVAACVGAYVLFTFRNRIMAGFQTATRGVVGFAKPFVVNRNGKPRAATFVFVVLLFGGLEYLTMDNWDFFPIPGDDTGEWIQKARFPVSRPWARPFRPVQHVLAQPVAALVRSASSLADIKSLRPPLLWLYGHGYSLEGERRWSIEAAALNTGIWVIATAIGIRLLGRKRRSKT